MAVNKEDRPAVAPQGLQQLSRRCVLLSGAAVVAGPVLLAAAQEHPPHPSAEPPEPLPVAEPPAAAHQHPPAEPPVPSPAEMPPPAESPAPPEPPAPAEPAPAKEHHARHEPGEPGRDYRSVFVPNGTTLPYRLRGGVKIFHLTAEPIMHEPARGLRIHCWGFNGRTPGPLIEVVEGDRVRIYVTNKLPAKTTIHWHAIILPNGMDGVAGMTQPAIPPGKTFAYEFTFPHHGTFMYHPHFDDMTQEGMGLTGMIVVHPRGARNAPDRDFAIMLHEWSIPGGTARPAPFEMMDFNILTMNGKAFPDTYPLVAELGDRVRIRLGNLSAMDHHPIHLHGYRFKITATDGGPIPESAQWPETTVLVHVGSTRTIEFEADLPGDWLMHCHMTHHTMNQMGHDIPNTVGLDPGLLDQKIRQLLPDYMTMGTTGMGEMAEHRMPVPENSIPMLGLEGQYGQTVMGGMVTVLKVRRHASGYDDPGWYEHPKGTVSYEASARQIEADGIMLHSEEMAPDVTSAQSGHMKGHH